MTRHHALPPPVSLRAARFARADLQMANAKLAFSRAALSCIAGSADAEQQVRLALELVDEARAELRTLCDLDADADAGTIARWPTPD